MPRRKCAFCGDQLPADARSNRKFCDDDCKRGRTKAPDAAADLGPVAAATEEAIAEGKATKRIGPLDAGAVAALRVLARKVDLDLPSDNVSLPTYLSYCKALGLIPAARAEGGPKGDGGGRKLGGHLAAVPRPGVG